MRTSWLAVSLLLVFGFVVLASAGQASAKASTTTTITGCSPSTTTVVGQSITCTAMVNGNVPTGSVYWSTKGAGTFSPSPPPTCVLSIVSGTCSITYTPSSTASTTINATYLGDVNNSPSAPSAALIITVNKATPSVSLLCSPSSVPVGSSTTCTAQVSNGYSVDGTTITFSGLQSSGKVTFPGGTTCSLSAGACGITVAASGVGSATIQASYPGDSNNVGPVSPTTSLTISRVVSSTTVVCAPATVIAGQQATCTATVKGYSPTGTVSWSSSDSAGVFSANPCDLGSSSCYVSYTASASATVTASYGGDGNNSVSAGSFFVTANVNDMIQITVANSGPPASVALSGCSVSPTTIQADGTAHTFQASSGCTGIVATLPPGGASTRYLTASGKNSMSIPSCSMSSCQLFSATVYYQLLNTYQVAPASPASWSAAGAITVSGTALGATGQTVCTITVSTGAGQFSCQGWSDYGTQTTLGALQVSQNQRWATGQSSFTDTSGGIQHSSNYYSQVLEDFQYSLVGSTTAPAAPLLSYTGFGTNSTLPLTGLQSLVWLDSGSSWSVPAAIAGSSSSERWECSITSGAATAGQTVALTYYHQFLVNFSFSVVGGGTAYVPPTVQFQSFGAPLQASQGWVDAGTTYTFTNPLSGSTSSERWFTPKPSAVASASGTDSVIYHHEYAFQFNFTVSGGGTYLNPRLNFTALGSPGLAQVNGTTATVWIDAGAKWGLSALLPNSSPTERWVTKQTTSGVASAPVLASFLYYHQYLGTLHYSILGTGGSPPVPTLNYTSVATSMLASLNKTAVGYWADSGSYWGVSLTLPGVQGERWLSNVTESIVTTSFDEDVQYAHQFYVEVGVSTSAGGQVANTNQWENQGSTVILNSTSARGWSFAYWQGVTPFSYNGTTRLPALTVLGPANETAIFFPGLTIITGSQGSVSYSFGTINGTVPSNSNATVYPPPGRNVTLTAMPATVSIKFEGWTGPVVGTQLPSALAHNLRVPVAIESPGVVHATFSTDYTDIRTFALASLGIFAGACFVFIVRRGHAPKL
jgi:hypothetical protein